MSLHAALLATLLLISASPSARELALVTPAQGRLRLADVKPHQLVAQFKGTTLVQGKLVAQWVPAIDEDRPSIQQFRLIVSAESALSLPYFEGYPVRKIEVTNGLAALRMSVPTAIYKKFTQRHSLIVEAEGLFELRGFVVGVECDAPWAKSAIVRAEAPTLLAANAQPVRNGC